MIRKAIIVMLLVGCLGTFVLWIASHFSTIHWQFGNPDLIANRHTLNLTFTAGRIEADAKWREEWRTEDGFTSSCCSFGPSLFPFFVYRPPNNPIPGVRYDLKHRRIEGKNSVREEPADQTDVISEERRIDSDVRVGEHGWRAFVGPRTFFTHDFAQRTELIVWVSLWLPVLILGIYPAITLSWGPLRRHRRRKRNQCIHCGYNLTGLPEPRCPECGKEI